MNKLLTKINDLLFKKFQPDITFLFDINPVLALKRIKARKSNNSFDKKNLHFYRTVRLNYLKLAEKHNRIIKLNAEAEQNEIFNNITNIIFNKIKS